MVVVDDFGFGNGFCVFWLWQYLVPWFCFSFFFFLFFFSKLCCVVVDKGERWLWPVVVVVGLADVEVFVIFLWVV